MGAGSKILPFEVVYDNSVVKCSLFHHFITEECLYSSSTIGGHTTIAFSRIYLYSIFMKLTDMKYIYGLFVDFILEIL